MKKAVCLFSGGLDSTTALYHACAEGYEVTALTLHYGQLHEKEIECARSLVKELDIRHYETSFSMPWGGSSLVDASIPIPTNRDESQMTDIPSTYVPARNTIFLSLAASLAESIEAEAIFIGANALDYSGYPDCRPDYMNAFLEVIKKGTKLGCDGKPISIQTPLIALSKKEIIEMGTKLGVPYEKTWSCYQGKEKPCGACDSCKLRAKGFREAGLSDPLLAHETSSHA